MQGEIGLKIKNITLIQFRNENNYDMKIEGINGEWLHICGDNDLKSLLERALEDIEQFPKP